MAGRQGIGRPTDAPFFVSRSGMEKQQEIFLFRISEGVTKSK